MRKGYTPSELVQFYGREAQAAIALWASHSSSDPAYEADIKDYLLRMNCLKALYETVIERNRLYE